MKVDYLNPFIRATTEVLRQFISDVEIERGELDLVDSPTETLGTMTYIGITGDLEGRVIYNMKRKAAVNIAGKMNGEEFQGMNNMVRSSIQELCNIITGNAGKYLHEAADGKDIEVTPPSLVTGRDTEVSDKINNKLIDVPLNTNYGEIIINLAVQEVN